MHSIIGVSDWLQIGCPQLGARSLIKGLRHICHSESLQTKRQKANFSCSTGLLLWKRCNPQVWLDDLEVREQLFRLLVFDAWVHDHVITRNPIDRSGNLVLIPRLERINDTQNLSSVSACRCGVRQDSADRLLRVDDEDRPDGEGNALCINICSVLVVQHVVGQSHLSLLIPNDGELQVAAADLVDVFDPSAMTLNGVCRQAN